MTAVRAVGFDLGETLFFYRGIPMNWSNHYSGALAAVAATLNLHLSPDNLAGAEKILLQHNTRVVPRIHEIPAENIFSLILNHWDIDISKNLQPVVSVFFSFFQQDLCAYPNAAAVLTQLRVSRVPVGLLTDVPYGMPEEFVKSDISRAGLAGLFDALVTSVDAGERKPHIAGFNTLSKKLQVRPNELLYVGNEEKDIAGAKAAGAWSVLIDRDDARPNYGQDYTVRSLKELPDILTRLS